MPHKVKFHYPFLNLFPDGVMSDINALRSGVLDVVAAKRNGTFVITLHHNLVEDKVVVS